MNEEVAALRHDVVGLPAHEYRVEFLPLKGSEESDLGSVADAVRIAFRVFRKVEVLVQRHLGLLRVQTGVLKKSGRDGAFQFAAEDDVRESQVQDTVLPVQPPVNRRAEDDEEDETEQDRPLVVDPDMFRLLGERQPPESFPVGCLFFFRAFHESPPSSSSSSSGS